MSPLSLQGDVHPGLPQTPMEAALKNQSRAKGHLCWTPEKPHGVMLCCGLLFRSLLGKNSRLGE